METKKEEVEQVVTSIIPTTNYVTYENIKKANDTIKTTDIKGKNYAEVNQRIKAFRMVYPTGYIHTHFHSIENGVCVILAEVGYYYNGEKKELGTGMAYEKENSTFINKTSYIENCETSAVGRALGMAGFGIDVSVASAEEVSNAIMQQENGKNTNSSKVTNKDVNAIKAVILKKGVHEQSILEHYGIKDMSEMTFEQFNDAMKSLSRYPDKDTKK